MLEAVLFGVIQGLTEFLPVSSSGHLALAMHLVDWNEPPLVMELIVHVGTLVAVCAVYGKDLLQAVVAGFKFLAAVPKGKAGEMLKEDESARLAIAVVVATIPTGVVALLIRDHVEHIATTPKLVGIMLSVCGVVLLASRWIKTKGEPLSVWRALAVGLVQGMAVIPGISRSGSTIVAGLALGLSRAEAARFSFLASVPAILGASIMELDPAVLASGGSGSSYLVAGVVALVVGYGALRFFVSLVRKGALWWFSLYMIPIGIVVVVWLG